MGRRIGSLFSNDSTIGRIMTVLWIIIASNILFSLVALPVLTIGPGLAALHYVMLKRLHSDSTLSPVSTFFVGLKQNLKQGLICTVMFLAIVIFLILDIRFCTYYGGILTWFKYALYAMGFFAVILWIHLMPVMAAFEDTIPHLLRNALFFAARNPIRAVFLAALWVVPMVVTYLDERMRPLYGFLWVTCGFGILAAVTSRALYRDIAQYLPKDPDDPEALAGGVVYQEDMLRTERQQKQKKREEMKKTGR